MAEQLENERRLIGGASFMDLQREMWTIKGNRNRALISIGLMSKPAFPPKEFLTNNIP